MPTGRENAAAIVRQAGCGPSQRAALALADGGLRAVVRALLSQRGARQGAHSVRPRTALPAALRHRLSDAAAVGTVLPPGRAGARDVRGIPRGRRRRTPAYIGRASWRERVVQDW